MAQVRAIVCKTTTWERWTRTSSKCQKMKNARAKLAKILFFIVKYANLRGFCCRRCRGCLAPYCDDIATHKRRSFLLCLYVINHPFQSIERTLSRFLTTRPTRNNREFKIYDATAATAPQILHISWTKTKPLHALHVLLLFLYISFPFSANLRREMTVSEVLKRTWTHKRKFGFSFLALTPHL